MSVLPRTNIKPALLRSVSTAAMVVLASFATTAHAQLRPSQVATLRAPSISPRAVPGQVRSIGATDALARQMATRTRAEQIRGFATQARAVVRSAPDGLAGLVKARGVTAEALAAGALRAARDSTGRLTWQGAALPVESSNGDTKLVTIDQTESRAILSWDRFDVGAKTTLQFNQKVGGVAQKDWVAVNRVVDPAASPSLILGSIVADGTVVVVNRNGMIFGSGAKVNANSLLASSLDIGHFAKGGTGQIANHDETRNGFVATTLQDRNLAFLQDGLLQGKLVRTVSDIPGMLVSAETQGFVEDGDQIGLNAMVANSSAGTVRVDRGASITAGKGGFVILAAPTLVNDGSLSAVEGQVSLQAGRAVSHTPSTGAATSGSGKFEDPNIRGLILRTPYDGSGSSVVNSGLIEAKRGYVSLGTSLSGSVVNEGLLTATTSVSRNGNISLTGGTIRLSGASLPGEASGIVILPDDNGETIPQGTAAQPAGFKASQISIGGLYLDLDNFANGSDAGSGDPLGELGPAAISFEENSLIHAPGATVDIGGKVGELYDAARYSLSIVPGAAATLAASRIDIAAGALIDVSGVKGIELDASRNSLLIDPIKRNELRDTPNYREVSKNGEFSLNGAAIYVDPRIRGVRDDGVAYVGSPLIEAGSAAGQIGITAEEFMAKGGTLNMAVATSPISAMLDVAPEISISGNATIDFSGGWVTYADGIVRTSRLLTVDGRVIDIGEADPNDRFVAVGDGFNEVQAKFGISRIYANSILQGARYEPGYDEGRDAGALIINAATATLDGALYGQAFAGVRQLAKAARPSAKSSVISDLRKVQASATELPSGGYLRVGVFGAGLGADIVVGDASTSAPIGAIRLDAAKLSSMGLSALSLRTSGGVTFANGSNLALANGGALAVEAGRAIRFDGKVTAVSGSISATTLSLGSVTRPGGGHMSQGSPFRSDDDLFGEYAADPELSPFDITVNGKLSAAGLWTNDFTGTSFNGKGWVDGGSISLTVAPNVFAEVRNSFNAADMSGSIVIASTALLDVSSGGYVAADGGIDFDAKGGNVSLINQTVYASRRLTSTSINSGADNSFPLGGGNQTVTFTPDSVGETSVVPSLVIETPRARVSFDVSSIKGFSFDGGGTFKLVAPDISMGSNPGGKGPVIGLDFLQRTGFGTLDLTATKSRMVKGLFTNGNDGYSAFLETERFVVGRGETLDLTQTLLPQLLDTATLNTLARQDTGTDVKTMLLPLITELDPWDRKAANLVLGGLTELEVEQGGSITGAAGASITIPRLYNGGDIRIAGGSIVQNDSLTSLFALQRVIGVRDAALGGAGLSDVLGGVATGNDSGFDENALVDVAVFKDALGLSRVTNGELFSYINGTGAGESVDAHVVFTGRVALNEGIHLAAGSTLDLSGTALYNPRAPLLANRQPQRVGRMVGGGSIKTARTGSATAASGYESPIDPSNRLVAEAGASINLDGASGVFDERLSNTRFGAVNQWSDAGKLVVGNGAELVGAKVSAFGGDDGDSDTSATRASGGLLDWVAPVIRGENGGVSVGGESLYAGLIGEAGFDTLIARDGFTTAGTIGNLNLGRAFIATTDLVEGTRTATSLLITATPGSIASITAPYIRLSSSRRTAGGLLDQTGTGNLQLNAQAMDIVGSASFNVGSAIRGGERGLVRLEAAGDIRLIGTAGVPDNTTGAFETGLDGTLLTNGDLFFQAAQVYATTGTGNLQKLLEDRRANRVETRSPYTIASNNTAGIIRFERQLGAIPDTPLSAGSYLRILGANIVQNGVLRAPLGLLEIGSNQSTVVGPLNAPATQSLSFGENSLTSVSARVRPTGDAAQAIPYGTTTDLIEYFFSPVSDSVLSTMPTGELRLAGKEIVVADGGNGVRIDGRGGGDVFAFEFIPGTGGSRDILDRFNPDDFSGNAGLQFPDGRQVFAILPKTSATAALFDPIYSADYGDSTDDGNGGGFDLYGVDAGLSVRLDAAPGIAAGEYLLLPAHYALLPGAMRIVENVGAAAPFNGGATELLDGSVLVGGVFATAGTSKAESQRRSFTVQSQDVIAKYSQIGTTSGSENIADLAERKGLAIPALPRDAARVVLSPLNSLKVAGGFANEAAQGGRSSQFDIGGTKIRIGAANAKAEPATSDFLLLTADTLTNFQANSLSIGALRRDKSDGTTALDVVANTILIDNDVSLSAPELLFAVGGPGSLLQIKDVPRGQGVGAMLTATGQLADTRTGDYVIEAPNPNAPSNVDQTGVGAVLRVATGPERLILRQGSEAARLTLAPARLDIGSGAQIRGAAISLDSSRTFLIDRTAKLGGTAEGEAFNLALSSDLLRIGSLNFRPEVEAQFAKASRLTLRSPDLIYFTPDDYAFNNLTIDAAGIGYSTSLTAETSDVTIAADNVVLRNSFADRGPCKTLCDTNGAGGSLTIEADTISLGKGDFRTYGFYYGSQQTGITLSAREGMFVEGVGQFSNVDLTTDAGAPLNDAPLNLITPFIVDRTTQDLRGDYVRPDYTFATGGALSITGPAGSKLPAAGSAAPGARLAFSSGAAFGGDISVENTIIRATAGTIDLTAPGSIVLAGTASLQTPGYTKTFDDGVDKIVVSASGGVINLISSAPGTFISAGADTSLIVDNGIGKAGLLNVSASQGEVSLLGQINSGIAASTDRSASFRLDTGFGAFDLSSFVTAYGRRFQGDIAIRSGRLDLSLAAGQIIKADSLSLTADGGRVLIAGKIDTSGDDVSQLALTDTAYGEARVDGGAISIFGREGVSLAGTAALISTTSGYNTKFDTRQASGGTVTIGIGIPESSETPVAKLEIASGAVINVAALRPGNRLIEKVVTDGLTQLDKTVYHMAPGDQGGLVNFRAPLLDNNTVNFLNRGKIDGARELSIEGYRHFDLDKIAESEDFSGIYLTTINGVSFVTLDPGQHIEGQTNFLTDVATGTIPDFIQNFSIADPNDELSGYRLRPGVELGTDDPGLLRGIRLVSDWNLGAGEIVDLDKAVDAGLLVDIVKESPLGTFKDGDLAGQKAYEVAYGKEGLLFENFVDMLYRVKGSVHGEAPVLTFRAAGDLNIGSSITDGFFTFHDRTNTDYINYQLGGGDRTYSPALNLGCGIDGSCSDSVPFSEAPPGNVAGSPGKRITILIGTAQQGTETSPGFIQAPYNPLANAASPKGTGDALGVADLFPLFSDGSSAHSSSLQFVGGAAIGSANPLQIDRVNGGSVKVSGEKTYNVALTSGVNSRISGPLQLSLGLTAADRQYYGLQELLDLLDSGNDSELNANYYTVINWGLGTTAAAAEVRERAKVYPAFVAADRFLGSKKNPTGVSARLRDVVAFLIDSGFGEDFAQGVANGTPGYNGPVSLQSPTARLRSPTVFVGTKVRTGDGSIDMAAATDIDLRRTPNVVNRRNFGIGSDVTQVGQVGGTAVYTAGVRAASGDLFSAQLLDAGTPNEAFLPGPTSGLASSPVLAKDGGSISLVAGRDVLGRRDTWSEIYGENGSPVLGNLTSPIILARGGYGGTTALMTPAYGVFGNNSEDQRWRFGAMSPSGPIASIAVNYFTSGVGALSGGDVSIRAGRDVFDMTVALDNSLVTGKTGDVQTLIPLGGGDLTVTTGRNLLGGQFDIASGAAAFSIDGNIVSAGKTGGTQGKSYEGPDDENLMRLRISDATASLNIKGSARIGGIGALGVEGTDNTPTNASLGFFTTLAGVSIAATEDIDIVGNRPDLMLVEGQDRLAHVLPPSLSLIALGGDILFSEVSDDAGVKSLTRPRVLYGSEFGQLTVLAGGELGKFALAMSDGAPTNLFGTPTAAQLGFPAFLSDTSDRDLRAQHDRRILHRDDTAPVRIVAGGSIDDVALALPKAARIRAGHDIVDMYFQGQNLRSTDITRISAGRDITGTVQVSTDAATRGRSVVLGNNFILGGPGALFVEAGRDLGPFITSATGAARSEAGGIRTIGNEANPWLGQQGADLYVSFGVAQGADYEALERAYLDPANLAQLDGDLFVQVEDEFGNKSPDRSRYIYAPVLAEWLRENHPDALAAVFEDGVPSGDALAQASFDRYAELYEAFVGLDKSPNDRSLRNRFLLDKLYFGELQATFDPNSESANEFIRGYRAIQTLFPTRLGYTDNLATYTTGLADAAHPLGYSAKNLVDRRTGTVVKPTLVRSGGRVVADYGIPDAEREFYDPQVADAKLTGNVDLRLSTIQTARGGNVTILGPGGNFIAGSVVRTQAQIGRRMSALNIAAGAFRDDLHFGNFLSRLGTTGIIRDIPKGLEGILTLRGGEIRGFTDGSFVLNQSRLFTQAGGDITLWSSNGDLNAGQGPRSSSNFPPIALRFSPNGFSEVNSAGSVSGAGIGAFKSSPDDPEASIRLIAPVGTVDAGDAGVRASGSIFVAAARVANADNFSAGGTISGVPSGALQAAPTVPASAASAIVANAVRAASVGDNADRLSRIFVDVLGYFGSDRQNCPAGQSADADGQCKDDSAR